jgi:cytochrome c1
MADRGTKNMVRIKTLSLALAFAAASFSLAGTARAQNAEPPVPARQSWSFAGPFGTYDQAQLQRGFKVFRQVCSNCHQASMLAFRNLEDPDGPGFSASQVQALAASYQIHDLDDSGQPAERPGRPSDNFPWNYPNDLAAAATLGKAPPDMSFLAKARDVEDGFPRFVLDALPIPGGMYQEGGPDYIYALLNGYTKLDDRNWNLYFPGNHIAMPSPLDQIVDPKTNQPIDDKFYTDGTPVTREQVAKDVTAFLMWMSEPTLEARKKAGFRVAVFLIVFAGLLFTVKKRIWADVHGEAAGANAKG